MKHVFIINPTAGKGVKQIPFVDAVIDYFKVNGGDCEIYYTQSQGDAQSYARRLSETGEPLRLYACGGEGTAFEVLNGVYGYNNVSMGVVPCGSANDFITYFSDKELFLDVPSLVDGEELTIDIIRAGDRYAMNSCSVGMDAMVASHMSKFKHLPFVSGKLAYVLAIFYTFFSRMGISLKVTLDHGRKTIEKNSLFAVVANAPYYGGGFYPTPAARPFDGRLDYSVIAKVSRPRVLSLLKKYRAGTHVNLDICDIGTAQTVTVEADREVPMNMDGEIFYVKKVDFEIVKQAVRLILPKTIANVWLEKAQLEKSSLLVK